VEPEREGLTATIPQMMAFLHFKTRYLTNVHSSSLVSFTAPLNLELDTSDTVGIRKQVRRGLKLLDPPEGYPPIGGDIQAVVFVSRLRVLGQMRRYSRHE
jgi:hypothetical protein